jgi:chorismate mutase
MPPKKQLGGLQRINGEWVNNSLSLSTLPPSWATQEAEQTPIPWLCDRPLIHALRRMAIMADVAAVRLLLSLKGCDHEKEEQIKELLGKNKVADRAQDAVQGVRELLKDRPLPETQVMATRYDDPDSDYSDYSDASEP